MKIKILSTSDVHGYIYPTDFSSRNNYSPLGYLKAASVIEKVRRECEANGDISIYIEDGDFIEGSPMTDYAYQTRNVKGYNKCLVKMIDHLQADVGILGNHEFNYGPQYLNETLVKRTYPILNANMQEGLESHVIDAPYTILEKKGVRIGILGLTTPYIPHWEQPRNIKGWKFNSALEAAKQYVPELRQQCDIVVVAYHGGFERDLATGVPTEELTGEDEGYAIVNEVPGIDAFVTGHQHRLIAEVVNGIPTTQPGHWAEKVGCITLELQDKHVIGATAELLDTSDADEEMWMNALTSDWNHDVENWLDEPLATVDGDMTVHDPMEARLHGNAYLNFVNHVEMETLGADIAGIALFNNDVKGYDSQVMIRNVMNSYFYPNTIVAKKVTGADLRQALERCASFFEVNTDGTLRVADDFAAPKVQLYNYDYYSGIDYTFDLRQPVGQRVIQLQYHGKNVAPNDELKISMSQYRGVGGGTYPMFSEQKIIDQSQKTMPQILIDYLKQHKKISAHEPTNLKVII